MKRINVLLADDHKAVREVFRSLLERDGKIKVVAEAKDGAQAVRLAAELKPEVALMDITMPKLNGLEAARKILESGSSTRILMLSVHSDEAYVDRAIAIGATGYLIKQGAAECLTAAVLAVEKGESYFSPSLAKRLGERDGKTPGQDGGKRGDGSRGGALRGGDGDSRQRAGKKGAAL